MRRGYSTASAVDIIADNLHVFVEQHKCRNIILPGRLLYCSRQRTFRIDTDEETVIACHAEIGAFDRRLNRCDRSARIGIIERRSLVFITSQQKSVSDSTSIVVYSAGTIIFPVFKSAIPYKLSAEILYRFFSARAHTLLCGIGRCLLKDNLRKYLPATAAATVLKQCSVSIPHRLLPPCCPRSARLYINNAIVS